MHKAHFGGNEKGKVYFILALHNHQPVGNLPEVFQDNFQRAYRPFLDVIYRFPEIKFTLHNSGILMEWIRQHQPAYLDKLRTMIDRGQVEIMGGGFYEPIMPVIRDEDKKGQVDKLTRWVKDNLNTTPQGMWLTERIWEPGLARPLSQAGMQYIVVDDTHFQEVGFEELHHYYITEEEGWSLKIFPISEKLRYLIPFRPPQETIDYLWSYYNKDENRVLVLADDGEKFGGWPSTYASVYEEGWLEHFLEILTDNSDWLQTATFSEYMQLSPPRGLVYLPASSYQEMKEWSRGFWRNFFIQYPESNRMHKKMLAVRRRIDSIPAQQEGSRYQALDHLWAGQCNCAYWHGVFGGLYLNFLRAGIWENLLQAEEAAEKAIHSEMPFLELRVTDRDYDGKEEVEVVTDRFTCLFAPHLGGSMWEFSWRPGVTNLLDTLTRREEDYHREIAAQVSEECFGKNGNQTETELESGLGEDGVKSIHEIDIGSLSNEELRGYLRYDNYLRGGLIEHLFSPDISFADFYQDDYRECVDEKFHFNDNNFGNAYKRKYENEHGNEHENEHKHEYENEYENEMEKKIEKGRKQGDTKEKERKNLLQPAQMELWQSDVATEEQRGKLSFYQELKTGAAVLILHKDIEFKAGSDEIHIVYKIENQGDNLFSGWFGSEFNLAMMSGDDEQRYYQIPGRQLQDSSPASIGEEKGVERLCLFDEWRGFSLAFDFSIPARLWRFPIETVSRSESGVEKSYQHSLVLPLWYVEVLPGESWQLGFTLKVRGRKIENDYRNSNVGGEEIVR